MFSSKIQVVRDVTNITLEPIFIFLLRLMSMVQPLPVSSPSIISLTLLWKLIKQVDQVPPTCKDLPFQRFIRNASLAARLDQR